jgi:hypothetical protein
MLLTLTWFLFAGRPASLEALPVLREVAAAICCEAARPEPGDLVVTEIMADPQRVPDAQGEYFAVRNVTRTILDLDRVVVHDRAKDGFVLRDIRLLPGATLRLGRSTDPNANGGVIVDATYSRFQLGNRDDAIILESGGVVIDEVTFDARQGWPVSPGRLMLLDPALPDDVLNDDPASWQSAKLWPEP